MRPIQRVAARRSPPMPRTSREIDADPREIAYDRARWGYGVINFQRLWTDIPSRLRVRDLNGFLGFWIDNGTPRPCA